MRAAILFSRLSFLSFISCLLFFRSALRFALTLLMTTTTTNAMKSSAMQTEATTMSGTA
jgi:hypothetical protein